MKLITPLLAALLLAGCQSATTSDSSSGSAGSSGASGASSASSDTRQARAELEPKSGSKVKGTANFTEREGKVRIQVKASGLKPNAEHAIHVHEKGDCSAADATSAGPHFNPDEQPHGHPKNTERHAGDLPNLRADSKGEVDTTFEVTGITLDNDFRGVLQRALVIHANPDDYKTQPAGGAGDRIACGVISKA